MHPAIALAVFPVIFIGELPDKTMFASLVMSSRGHPRSVWLGAAAAFLIHVVIATTIGVGLFKLLPHRALDLVVAALFLGGAVYSWREGQRDETALVATRGRVAPPGRGDRLRRDLPGRVGRPDPDPDREPGRQVPGAVLGRTRFARRALDACARWP